MMGSIPKLSCIIILLVLVTTAYSEDEGNAPTQKVERLGTLSSRDQLMSILFRGYNKDNHPDNINVKVGLAVTKVHFDEDLGLMKTDGWMRMVWRDKRLAWNGTEKGIDILHISPEKLWIPDITLPKSSMDCLDTRVIIFPSGEVMHVPPCRWKSFCNITLKDNPFGEQICKLRFGSWTMDLDKLDLQFDNGGSKVDVNEYSGVHYEMTENKGLRDPKEYPCCQEPFVTLEYVLGFTRIPMVTPCMKSVEE